MRQILLSTAPIWRHTQLRNAWVTGLGRAKKTSSSLKHPRQDQTEKCRIVRVKISDLGSSTSHNFLRKRTNSSDVSLAEEVSTSAASATDKSEDSSEGRPRYSTRHEVRHVSDVYLGIGTREQFSRLNKTTSSLLRQAADSRSCDWSHMQTAATYIVLRFQRCWLSLDFPVCPTSGLVVDSFWLE